MSQSSAAAAGRAGQGAGLVVEACRVLERRQSLLTNRFTAGAICTAAVANRCTLWRRRLCKALSGRGTCQRGLVPGVALGSDVLGSGHLLVANLISLPVTHGILEIARPVSH